MAIWALTNNVHLRVKRGLGRLVSIAETRVSIIDGFSPQRYLARPEL